MQRIKHVAIGNPLTVPAGRYAKNVLEKEGLYAKLQKAGKLVFAESVRQALSYLQGGMVDAALIYRTDAHTKDLRVVQNFSESETGKIEYPIAVVKGAKNAAAANRFLKFVLSEPGQQALRNSGFLSVTPR